MTIAETRVYVRRVKRVPAGVRASGAWKVAYADFVTAMMAFFLLMWLVNTTNPDQKRGLADYFSPGSTGTEATPVASRSQAERDDADRQTAALVQAAADLRQALEAAPELAPLARQVLLDQTPEGLCIQLIDQEGRSMYPTGSTELNARARGLLLAVAQVANRLPNRISLAGHTSESATGADADWALSAGRAESARALLTQAGVDPDRIYAVSGKAGSEPLYPDAPQRAGNRRLTVTLLREAPLLPPDHSL